MSNKLKLNKNEGNLHERLSAVLSKGDRKVFEVTRDTIYPYSVHAYHRHNGAVKHDKSIYFIMLMPVGDIVEKYDKDIEQWTDCEVIEITGLNSTAKKFLDDNVHNYYAVTEKFNRITKKI